jgi:hypothetical protein
MLFASYLMVAMVLQTSLVMCSMMPVPEMGMGVGCGLG